MSLVTDGDDQTPTPVERPIPREPSAAVGATEPLAARVERVMVAFVRSRVAVAIVSMVAAWGTSYIEGLRQRPHIKSEVKQEVTTEVKADAKKAVTDVAGTANAHADDITDLRAQMARLAHDVGAVQDDMQRARNSTARPAAQRKQRKAAVEAAVKDLKAIKEEVNAADPVAKVSPDLSALAGAGGSAGVQPKDPSH